MTPFDLQKALAGEPVQTGHGLKVKRIEHFPDAKYTMRLAVLFEDNIVTLYPEDGTAVGALDDSWDLFMAPKPRVKKEGWVVLWHTQESGKLAACCSHVYPTRELAEASSFIGKVAITRIEWEEEV